MQLTARSWPLRALAVGLFAASMLTACEEPDPAPELPLPAPEPDPALEGEAWPRWASAMQVEGCRDAAVEARRLVRAARTEPAHIAQARRRLAELDVCLDRNRPSIEITDDPIWRVELDLTGPEGVEAANAGILRCARGSVSRPDGEVFVSVRDAEVTLERSTLGSSVEACVASAIAAARVASGGVRATLRAGLAYSRPCLHEEGSGRRPRVTRVEGPAGPIEVFLYARGIRLTSFGTRSGEPLGAERRAALSCPIVVDRSRPLGVLALQGDRVLGWAETGLAQTPTELSVGAVRVTLDSASR